jgi:hypothetical protein
MIVGRNEKHGMVSSPRECVGGVVWLSLLKVALPLLDCLTLTTPPPLLLVFSSPLLPPLHLIHLFLAMMTALKMTPPILATAPTASASAEFISRPQTHIEIIDPPNKLRQEIKTKNNPGTRHGNEFGATLTSCGDTPDDPAELPSLAVPGSDSDGKDSLAPLICFGQFAADPHAGRGLPLDPNFSRAADVLIFPYDPAPPSLVVLLSSLIHPLHAPGN